MDWPESIRHLVTQLKGEVCPQNTPTHPQAVPYVLCDGTSTIRFPRDKCLIVNAARNLRVEHSYRAQQSIARRKRSPDLSVEGNTAATINGCAERNLWIGAINNNEGLHSK